jgi:hypothetical protein
MACLSRRWTGLFISFDRDLRFLHLLDRRSVPAGTLKEKEKAFVTLYRDRANLPAAS